jgi:hypothetical protein
VSFFIRHGLRFPVEAGVAIEFGAEVEPQQSRCGGRARTASARQPGGRCESQRPGSGCPRPTGRATSTEPSGTNRSSGARSSGVMGPLCHRLEVVDRLAGFDLDTPEDLPPLLHRKRIASGYSLRDVPSETFCSAPGLMPTSIFRRLRSR